MSRLVDSLGRPGSYTFAMLKPDGVCKGLLSEILGMAARCDAVLVPVLIQEHTLTEADVAFLYGHVKREHPEVYPTLEDFSRSGPSYLIVFRLACLGDYYNAVTAWRGLMGATRSANAEAGTIRNLWGSREVTCRNVVHGSDSHARAYEEISYFAQLLGW